MYSVDISQVQIVVAIDQISGTDVSWIALEDMITRLAAQQKPATTVSVKEIADGGGVICLILAQSATILYVRQLFLVCQ